MTWTNQRPVTWTNVVSPLETITDVHHSPAPLLHQPQSAPHTGLWPQAGHSTVLAQPPSLSQPRVQDPGPHTATALAENISLNNHNLFQNFHSC